MIRSIVSVPKLSQLSTPDSALCQSLRPQQSSWRIFEVEEMGLRASALVHRIAQDHPGDHAHVKSDLTFAWDRACAGPAQWRVR